MLREREPPVGVSAEPRSIVSPGRIGRSDLPGTTHSSQGEQRSRFAKAFFQPEIGVGRITHQPLRIITEVGQRMAELVGKLKAVLGPVSVLSGEANRDTPPRRALGV